MTTQEKLKEIEQQIRKDIPRLMEPTRGCLVKEKFTDDEEICKIIDIQGDRLVIYNSEDYFLTTEIEETLNNKYEIIGHEIMLNDVLEWLDDDYIGGILTNGIIGKRVDASENWTTLLHEENDNEFIFWDFYSPYLKDQSEELINFLYKLKNQ